MLHKTIPEDLRVEAQKALSFYPEFKETPIEFKLTKKTNSSLMKAQPKFWSLFKSRDQREYVILISKSFDIAKRELHSTDLPQNVLIGWLGHELGHLLDYHNRSSINLIGFGIGYIVSNSFLRKAEIAADRYAVSHHMEKYILETKNYILNHTALSQKYKEKIKRLYVSPEQILEFVNELKSQQ